VHRLDKETSGCLLIAKTRFCGNRVNRILSPTLGAQDLLGAGGPAYRSRSRGGISTYLAKEESEDDTIMRGRRPMATRGASHGGDVLCGWSRTSATKTRLGLSLKPVTGRNPSVAGAHGPYRPCHRRRPEILQQGKLATARRAAEPAAPGLARPYRDFRIRAAGFIDVHGHRYRRTCCSRGNLLGLEADRFDPIENAPEE